MNRAEVMAHLRASTIPREYHEFIAAQVEDGDYTLEDLLRIAARRLIALWALSDTEDGALERLLRIALQQEMIFWHFLYKLGKRLEVANEMGNSEHPAPG